MHETPSFHLERPKRSPAKAGLAATSAETAAVVAARVGWRAATETDSWVIEGRGSPR